MQFPSFNPAIWGKHLEEDVRLPSLAPQSNSSNCIVLIPHRLLGNYLLGTRNSYSLPAQHICKTLYKSMFDTYQPISHSLRPRKACWTESWCQSIVVIYVEKVSSWSRNSPAYRMGTGETPATKALDGAASHRVPRYIGVLAIIKTFLTQEEIISAHTGMCCLLIPKNRGHSRCILPIPKGLKPPQISLQIQCRAKINITMIFNLNLRRKMT